MFQVRSINVRCKKSASVKKSTARYYRYIIVLEKNYYPILLIPQCHNTSLNTASKLKQKSELLNDEVRSKEEEKRRRREAIARLKAQQRSEVRIIIIIRCDLIIGLTYYDYAWIRSMHLISSWLNLKNRNFKPSYQEKCSPSKVINFQMLNLSIFYES